MSDLRERVIAAIRAKGPHAKASTIADAVMPLFMEEAARALYGCTRFDQEIFDSMAESRDGTYVKVEDAEAAIRALANPASGS